VEIEKINLHTVHFGLEFGDDFVFHFSPAFGIDLGAGYVKAAKANAVKLIKRCATTTITANPRDRGFGF